jgi:hypothetical protein
MHQHKLRRMSTAQLVDLRDAINKELEERIRKDKYEGNSFCSQLLGLTPALGIKGSKKPLEPEAWRRDNTNKTEKAQILSEPRRGVGGARWRAYVERCRARDAELEGDWEAKAAALAKAEEWDRMAAAWEVIEPLPRRCA